LCCTLVSEGGKVAGRWNDSIKVKGLEREGGGLLYQYEHEYVFGENGKFNAGSVEGRGAEVLDTEELGELG
jgi:hypothetical protein